MVSNLPVADTYNKAGGKAYSLSAKRALAQYVCTGVFNNTFYTSGEEQLAKVLELCQQVEPEFVAKLAVYSRKSSFMKDMPALLVAYLGTINRADLLNRVFPKVIDSPKMLRNVVQMWRSGVVGRKSLGTRPKKLVQEWFAKRNAETIFRGSIGNNPSLADVIKMIHPHPENEEKTALYGWLIGAPTKAEWDKMPEDKRSKYYYKPEALPQAVRNFEVFKKNPSLGELPHVPFEMLTALPLTDQHWVQIAREATWTQTRINLNTFLRHNVFKEDGMDELVARRLADPELVQKAKVFPYQLMAAYLNVENNMPNVIKNALQNAMEIAVSNIPAFEGKVYIFPDVSRSMHSSVTGDQGTVTSKVRCIDVAGLFAAAILRMNPTAEMVPFGEKVCEVALNAKDSIMTNAARLARLNGGGTNCDAPLTYLNEQKAKGDLCIYLSDNESWQQSSKNYITYRSTTVMAEWEIFKKRNPTAKLACIDIQPSDTTQAPDRKDILNCGGFSDAVFNVIEAFNNSKDDDYWVKTIQNTDV